MSAHSTPKRGLFLPVGFLAVSTLRARTRGVTWVHHNHRYPCTGRFVLDEGAKLVKSPSGHLASLRLAKPSAATDVRQVFQRQPLTAVLSLRNELFSDVVVGVSAVIRFFACQRTAFAVDCFRPLGLPKPLRSSPLQVATTTLYLLTFLLHILAGKVFAVVSGGQPLHAKVHPDVVGNGIRRRVWHLGIRLEKPQPIMLPLKDRASRLDISPLPTMKIALLHPDGDTSLQRQHRDYIVRLERQQAVVVSHGRVGSEGGTNRLIALVGGTDHAQATSGHLRRQTKAFSEFVVVQVVQRIRVGQLAFKSLTSQPVSRLIEAGYGLAQRLSLVGCRQQLDLKRQFHIMQIQHESQEVKVDGLSLSNPAWIGISRRQCRKEQNGKISHHNRCIISA